MPTPKISQAVAKQTKAAIEKALKAGYRPPGVTGNGPGAVGIAGTAMGLPRTTVANRLHSMGEMGFEPDWSLYKSSQTIGSIPTLPDKSAEQADEIKSLKRRLKELESTATVERLIVDIIGNIAEETQKRETPTWLTKLDSRSKQQCTPITMWSDWHIGESVSSEEMFGLNKFDSLVAQKRVQRLVEKTIYLCRNNGPGNYPGIVVMLGGDMVTGDIHEELARTNYATLQESVYQAFDLLAWALEKIADEFGRVYIPCVAGNHGRGTHKPVAKMTAQTNFDFLISQLLARHFKKDKRLQFDIPLTNEVNFKVYNDSYRLLHGDMMGPRGGGNGFAGALMPILHGANRVGNQASAYGKPHNMLCMGHWHQSIYLSGHGVLVNGTLKGVCEYAFKMLRAPPTPASQFLVFTDPVHGIISHSNVFLQDRVKFDKDAAWIQWAA